MQISLLLLFGFFLTLSLGNLLTGKTTLMSSQYSTWEASYGNNGVLYESSMMCTNYEQGWWQVTFSV